MTTGATLPPYSVQVRVLAPDHARVLVRGEIDMDSGPRIERALRNQLDSGRVHLQLDLAEVAFFDSSGIHLLLRISHTAAQVGGRLTLVAAGPRVVRLLEVTGLTRMLPPSARPRPLDQLPDGPYGTWSWDLTTDTWWWSPRLFQVHGLPAADVAPSRGALADVVAELVAATPDGGARTGHGWHDERGHHVGPGTDRSPRSETTGSPGTGRTRSALVPDGRHAAAFTARHVVNLPDGTSREVVTVGDTSLDAEGHAVFANGFMVAVGDVDVGGD